MVDGLRLDGLVRVVGVLVVKCVGKFSLPGGGLIILFFHYNGGFWYASQYEDSISDYEVM